MCVCGISTEQYVVSLTSHCKHQVKLRCLSLIQDIRHPHRLTTVVLKLLLDLVLYLSPQKWLNFFLKV